MKTINKLLTISALMFCSSQTLADLSLNNQESNLSFVSVKKSSIAEVHHFSELKGLYDDKSGKVTIEINLASVETLIPTRNQRMQSLLFKTELYPKALITGKVNVTDVNQLNVGDSLVTPQQFSLNLHGITHTLNAELKITKLSKGQLNVSSVKPVIVNAADFKLLDGIAALKNIAALPSIATQVPVTFNLVFDTK